MNPWLDDDADGTDQVGLEAEGALFARRARALPVPSLPSLDAILAEADAPRLARARRAKSVERGRAWAATFAAAACVAALFTRAPGFEGAGGIVAEPDAGAPAPQLRTVSAGPFLSAAPSRGDTEATETCDPSSDEASGRSACARTMESAMSSMSAPAGGPIAQVLVDEDPGTCSEPTSDVVSSHACDRAMSCSLANAGP